MIRLFAAAAAVALSGAALAYVGPRAEVGLWEVSDRADGHGASRVCIRNVSSLLQWEHRGVQCRQTVLADGPRGLVVDYVCGARGFGHSRLTTLTPRTLKIETQGISNGFPFQYTLHARRIGDCPVR